MRVSFTCSPQVAELFQRAVGCVSAELGQPPGLANVASCLRWMLGHFADTHASPEHEARWRSYAILDRDCFVCGSPHCREVGPLHVHHYRPRSQGGPLKPWNEGGECEGCHLGVIHRGHVKTSGRAPDDVTFSLGASSPRGVREMWRDERLIWAAPREQPRWRPVRDGLAPLRLL